MFAIVPTGRRYRARVQSEVVRKCTCERCGKPFAYKFTVSGGGTGRSFMWLRNEAASEDAHKAAVRAMQKTAQNAFPPFPCPNCRHFQAGMVKYYKKTRLPRVFRLSVALLVIVLACGIFGGLSDTFRSELTSGPFLFWLSLPCALIAGVLLVRALAQPKRAA